MEDSDYSKCIACEDYLAPTKEDDKHYCFKICRLLCINSSFPVIRIPSELGVDHITNQPKPHERCIE